MKNDAGEPICKVCGKLLPILSIVANDPYCTTQCCKDDHNVKWPT